MTVRVRSGPDVSALAAVVELLFVRAAGHAAALKEVWWAVFPAAVAAGFMASIWSKRSKMGKRAVAGITAGALAGLAYGLVNTYLAPSFPGFVAPAAAAADPAWLPLLWKTFIFALLAIPGAFVAETRPVNRGA